MKEDKRLERIERLLRYIMIYLHNSQKDYVVDRTYVKIEKIQPPDIGDIIKALKIYEERGKDGKIYLGKDAGKDMTGHREDISPGPVAGISGATTKCLWCGKMFNAAMASCGTGSTWSLFKCPHCNKEMASGNIIPTVVKNDPKIKIMKGR